ncbi:MAG: hypothetical protein JJ992_28920, partial [Planctomycetes bacterium]|nr:hypothetical protein [Planctomycetota bacterium]
YKDQIFDYVPSSRPVHIAIGKGHADLPDGTLCIGNCTVSQRDKGLFVPGCPPVGSEIFAAISRSTSDDDPSSDESPPGDSA